MENIIICYGDSRKWWCCNIDIERQEEGREEEEHYIEVAAVVEAVGKQKISQSGTKIVMDRHNSIQEINSQE